MLATLANVPWWYIAVGYLGWAIYIVTSLANPADESLASIGDVFFHKGRTVLGAALVTPFLVIAAQQYNQLNLLSAFCGGYLNVSLLRKVTEAAAAKFGPKEG